MKREYSGNRTTCLHVKQRNVLGVTEPHARSVSSIMFSVLPEYLFYVTVLQWDAFRRRMYLERSEWTSAPVRRYCQTAPKVNV